MNKQQIENHRIRSGKGATPGGALRAPGFACGPPRERGGTPSLSCWLAGRANRNTQPTPPRSPPVPSAYVSLPVRARGGQVTAECTETLPSTAEHRTGSLRGPVRPPLVQVTCEECTYCTYREEVQMPLFTPAPPSTPPPPSARHRDWGAGKALSSSACLQPRTEKPSSVGAPPPRALRVLRSSREESAGDGMRGLPLTVFRGPALGVSVATRRRCLPTR